MKKYIINNWLFGLLVALPVLFSRVQMTKVCPSLVCVPRKLLTQRLY